MTRARRSRDRTRAVGVAVSLALHAVVLGWLGLRAAAPLRSPPEEQAPLTVELVRPPPLVRSPAAAPSTPQPPAARAIVRDLPLAPRPRPAAPPPPLPVPPRPLPLPPIASGAPPRGGGASAAGQAGARPAPGPLPGQEMQGDLRGFLRGTVGCSHEEYLRLSPAERARCDNGFATAARTAPSIPLPDDKLAAFARQADANARKRARREGSMEDTLPPCPADMVGSNLGLSCLPPQAHMSVGKF